LEEEMVIGNFGKNHFFLLEKMEEEDGEKEKKKLDLLRSDTKYNAGRKRELRSMVGIWGRTQTRSYKRT